MKDMPDGMSFGAQWGEEVALACPEHGAYTGRRFTLTGEQWFTTPCPVCEAQARMRAEAAKRAEAERKQAEREARRAILAGIPPRFRGASLEGFRAETPEQQRVAAIIGRYIERFEDRREAGGGLILLGKPGTGKTHLLCAIGRALMHRWQVKYTDCWSMVSAVKDAWRSQLEDAEADAIARFVAPDLLLVDEVGVAYGSDAERAIIHRVLDLRYQAVKPTIVAGNVDLAGMEAYLGERAVSRLHDGGGAVLVCDWDDWRRRKVRRG